MHGVTHDATTTHSKQPCSLLHSSSNRSSTLQLHNVPVCCLQVKISKGITADIMNSSTAEELAARIDQHIDRMDTINLSAAIMRLQKLRVQQPQPFAVCVQRYLQFAAADSTRNLSNVVYALCKAPPAIRRQHKAKLQEQLVPAFMAKCAVANAQDISNVLYGMADSGQHLPEEAVQQLLAIFVGQLQQATPQAVANTLLACAKLGCLPQHLLAARGLAARLQAGTPQELANAAWACGQLGHRDEQLMAALLAEVQQRLTAAETGSSRSFNSQELCNLCWAVAVLDLQQHAQQVLQLVKACSSIWSSIHEKDQQQLWQAHIWLLDCDLAGGQGLQGSLTQQQLQQCRAAWDQALRKVAAKQHSEFQRSVFAAVQRLPTAWQQQPQMEQLSVGRDGVTPDGALLIDIAGRTADGVLVAVEADGPRHFRQPDGGLMGTTQYRNRALAVRGYRLVSVLTSTWDKVWRDKQGQDQYLMQLFMKAGLVGGRPTATTGG
jgi:hypothetical protein